MSPDNFYNEEYLNKQVIVQDIRHNYAFIFSQIVQLFKFYHPDAKSLTTKAEDVKSRMYVLKKEEKISDYLYENFFVIMKQYPTMLPSELYKEKMAVGEEKQYERLDNLKQLLNLFIGDLSDDISDIVKEQAEYNKRDLIRKYFN